MLTAATLLAFCGVLCADSSFTGRPVCIYRQCQKPVMAGLTLYAENNARMRNSRKFDGFQSGHRPKTPPGGLPEASGWRKTGNFV